MISGLFQEYYATSQGFGHGLGVVPKLSIRDLFLFPFLIRYAQAVRIAV